MDLFGLETRRENRILRESVNSDSRTRQNHALRKRSADLERLLAALIATAVFAALFYLRIL